MLLFTIIRHTDVVAVLGGHHATQCWGTTVPGRQSQAHAVEITRHMSMTEVTMSHKIPNMTTTANHAFLAR